MALSSESSMTTTTYFFLLDPSLRVRSTWGEISLTIAMISTVFIYCISEISKIEVNE
jgi:hypothetical protein